MFYRLDPFQVALAYNSMFTQLVQTPSGADAVYEGKIVQKAHQRYFETVFFFLDWAHHGANAPETVKTIEQVNRIHKHAWAKAPGSGHFAWEAQMAIVVLSYFEVFVRKTVGASVDAVPEQIRAAWPIWSAQVISHFSTEAGAILPNFGANYPRTFDEIENFFWWWEELAFEKHTTSSQRRKAHELSLLFEQQFSELFFPPGLLWFGREVFRTFVPPKCRRRNNIREPNRIVESFIKFGIWLKITVQDRFLPDPVLPPLMSLLDMMKMDRKEIRDIDAEIKRGREVMLKNIVLTLCMGFLLLCSLAYRYWW